MVSRRRGKSSSMPTHMSIGCCRVESVVSVDNRGQMVLPKDVRNKAGIGVGDKLALLSWEKGGKACCISLIKVENLATMARDMLGPMIKEILGE